MAHELPKPLAIRYRFGDAMNLLHSDLLLVHEDDGDGGVVASLLLSVFAAVWGDR